MPQEFGKAGEESLSSTVMGRRLDQQRVDDVQHMVHGAMEKAMQASGLRTARGLAQTLNEHGYAVSERTVTGWRNRESGIPAWALVAFGQITGLGVDSLLGSNDVAGLVARVAEHDRVIGEMQATLIAVCEKVGVPWRPAPRQARDLDRASELG